MRRHPLIVPVFLSFSIALGGCRVERTPDEYFDHASSIEAEREAAEAEVRARLQAFLGAVTRGSAAEALIALSPAAEVEVVAPRDIEVNGADSVRDMMGTLVTTPVSLRLSELEVETGPEATVAWFEMVVEAPGTTAEPSLYRATGTYLLDAGLWELVQAHVSGPITSDSASSPPDSASTPEEAE